MKSVIKICNMESHNDTKIIQEIVASEISLTKK